MANPTALNVNVDRFIFDGVRLARRDDGDYVRYEDYEKQLSAALQYKHELEEARAEIARMREARRERLASLIPETSRE